MCKGQSLSCADRDLDRQARLVLSEALATVCLLKEYAHQAFRTQNKLNKILRGVLAISTSVRVRPLFFFYFYFFIFLDAIVLATYQVVFAGFVFNQFLSDFKKKHTAAKVL